MAQHDPISIVGDVEFTAENGVAGGIGTSSDPYIIENLEIGPNEKYISILIMNTHSYFTIRNVYIFTADIGIMLNNATHGRVENSRFTNTSIGVSLYSSDSCKVTLNTFEQNLVGILISYCDSTQSKNTFIDCETNVKKVDFASSIETSWVGTAVCIVALIPLSIVMALLVYYRVQSIKTRRRQPPLQ